MMYDAFLAGLMLELPRLGTAVAILGPEGETIGTGNLTLYRDTAEGRLCWIQVAGGTLLPNVPAEQLRPLIPDPPSVLASLWDEEVHP